MNPKAVGVYGEYSLFESEGRYYATSNNIQKSEVDEIINSKKAIEAASEIELIRILKESEKWADTRGLYGLEERSPENKAHIKVNSFNMEPEAEFELENPCLFKNSDGLFLVEKDDLPSKKRRHGLVMEEDLKGVSFVGAVSTGVTPELIFEYKKFNIVEYDRVFYGIPLKLGPVNLEECNPKLLRGVLYTDLVKDTMTAIDRYWGDEPSEGSNDTRSPNDNFNKYDALPSSNTSNSFGEFVENYRGYNIFLYEKTYICYPDSHSKVNFADTDYFCMPNVIYDVSIFAIKELINDELAEIDQSNLE
ncbi:MAG: hypothetical protein VYA17_14710 [Pseudomonadota bacterium]|nr:hypothetical protein [Pseudomonadota bacterium]